MAVELLVRRFDGPGGRHRGDIVSAKTLPHRGWGKEEGPPNYAIIRIEDKAAKEIESYLKRHVPILFDAEGNPTKTYRNAFRINIDVLPIIDQEAINTIGMVYTDWSVVSSKLVNVIALDKLGIR